MATRELWHWTRGALALALLREPRDLWVGIYWTWHWELPGKTYVVYVALIPVFPLRVTWHVRG